MPDIALFQPSVPDPRALRPAHPLRWRAAACLPARFPAHACAHCRAACPTGALGWGAHGPELAPECADCGQCVAVCPTEALSLDGFATAGVAAASPSDPIAIDCWRVPVADSPRGAWRVPCLGGVTAADLLEVMTEAAGRPIVFLDRGFCARCPAGGQRAAETPGAAVLAEVGALLAALEVPADAWPRPARLPLPAACLRQEAGMPLLETRLSRRAFWSGALRPVIDPTPTPEHAPEHEKDSGRPGARRQRLLAALRRLAPRGQALPDWLFPRLVAREQCVDHRLCASACPSGALTAWHDAGDGASRAPRTGLRFEPAACLACGLCVALCPEQALTLAPAGAAGAGQSPRTLSAHVRRRCPECAAEHSGHQDLCAPCAKDRDFARGAFQLFGGPATRDPVASPAPPFDCTSIAR